MFLFNVYEFADEVTRALAALFPQNPPRFLARTPHGYHDRPAIEGDLHDGGFTKPADIATTFKSRADSPRIPAIAYCKGTPVSGEIAALERRGDRSRSAGVCQPLRQGDGGRKNPGAVVSGTK